MVCPASCSALLTISSSATVLMVTAGAMVSTVKVCVVWPLLPALSLTEAVTVSAPRSGRPVGCRHVERPCRRCRQAQCRFSSQRHGNGLTRLRAGRSVHGQRLLRFRRIQHIVARQRVHANHRRGGVHADGVRRRGCFRRCPAPKQKLVARAVGRGAHVGGRYGGCPEPSLWIVAV